MKKEIQPVTIPRDLLTKAFEESRGAYPSECCGWMAGAGEGAVESIRPCANQQDRGGHPIAAERGSETAYVIEGDDLLKLNQSFDGDIPARIIYHSHPNGKAYLSKNSQITLEPRRASNQVKVKPPPLLGENSNEVLTGLLGLGEHELDALRSSGVI